MGFDSVRGLNKVIVSLKYQEKKLTDNELKSKIQIVAQLAAEKARIIVPKRTRELMRSIHATQAHKIPKGWQIEVKAEKHYAIWVEIGTKKQRKQPYLSKGLKQAKESVKSIFSSLGL